MSQQPNAAPEHHKGISDLKLDYIAHGPLDSRAMVLYNALVACRDEHYKWLVRYAQDKDHDLMEGQINLIEQLDGMIDEVVHGFENTCTHYYELSKYQSSPATYVGNQQRYEANNLPIYQQRITDLLRP